MAPVPINHIGLTIPDIYGAIDWYSSVLGFRLVMGPCVMQPGDDPAVGVRKIYGEDFRKAYQAHLLSANGVGLELFQFVEPSVEPAEPVMHYARRGIFHFCVTVEDVAETLLRVEAAGGTRMCDAVATVPGRPWWVSYCRDPWGTPIELMSHSYSEIFSGWPQPGTECETLMLARDGSEYAIPARPA